MAKAIAVHLIKPGSSAWTAGIKTIGTYCGRAVSGNDVNDHALTSVTCATCVASYNRKH